jgi:hypothetical protein
MIKDVAFWEAWEREFLRNEPVDFARNLRLLDAMYEHARLLGVFPPADPLEGIEVKIRMARIFNQVASSRPRPS